MVSDREQYIQAQSELEKEALAEDHKQDASQ